MYLILDTNILHQEGLASHNMQMLMRLADSGFLTVCVPSLVRREYIERVVQDSLGLLQSVSTNLEKVGKKISRRSDASASVDYLRGRVGELGARIEASFSTDFDQWAAAHRIEVIEYDNASTSAVLDDYFAGTGPFRNKRSREDLIDGMIHATIQQQLLAQDNVVVAMKDGTFRDCLQTNANITVVDSIGELLSRDDMTREIQRLDSGSDIENFRLAFADPQLSKSLINHVTRTQSILDTIYIEEEVSGVNYLEIDCFSVRVNGPESKDVKFLELGEVDYLGAGRYSLEFRMEAVAKLDFCAAYGDYLDLSISREKEVEMSSMNGAGVCDLEEMRLVLIAGRLLIDMGRAGVEVLWDQRMSGRFPAENFFIEFEAESASIRPKFQRDRLIAV